MTTMLADLVRDHLIDVIKSDGPFPTDKAATTYVSNCLSAGAVAYAIHEAKKEVSRQENVTEIMSYL